MFTMEWWEGRGRVYRYGMKLELTMLSVTITEIMEQ